MLILSLCRNVKISGFVKNAWRGKTVPAKRRLLFDTFEESQPLESQQANRSCYEINCQNFNKLPPCIINAGYSRTSLPILVPYDTMWLNTKPLPPTCCSFSRNSTARSARVVKIKCVPSFYCPRRGAVGHGEWFCAHNIAKSRGWGGRRRGRGRDEDEGESARRATDGIFLMN